MAIDVTCAACKTRFQVSDKFAGKQGPCPKCKAIITVPSKKDEVVIHAPEVSGPKDSKGHYVLKPLSRVETKLTALNIGMIVGTVVVLLLGSLTLRIAFHKALRTPAAAAPGTKGDPKTKEGTPAETEKNPKEKAKAEKDPLFASVTVPPSLQFILALGAIFLAPAAAFGGYTFLRNDELEPYRGTALYGRLLILSVAYPLLWGIYWALFAFFADNFESGPPLMALAIVVPLLVMGGAFVAHATLDVEYGTALLHCGMYLGVTVLLRLIIGLPPHWTSWGT